MGGLVDTFALGVAAARAEHFRPFGEEIAQNVDGTLEQAAAVAAQVEHNTLEVLRVAETGDGVAHLVGRTLDELRQVDVADAGRHDAGVRHRRGVEFLALEGKGKDGVGSHPRTRHLYGEP